MPSTRKRQGSSSRSTPYDMGKKLKLAEWNIVAPPNFSKAELKSLYLANLSQRSIESQPSEVPHGSHLPQEASCTSATDNLNPDNTETLSQQPRQELSSQTSVLLNMVNTMSSLVKQVLDKQEGKDDVSRQTLDAFSTNRTQMHTGGGVQEASAGCRPTSHPVSQSRPTTVELQHTVNNLIINSVSRSTRVAYQTGIKTFIQFLLLQGLVHDCSRLPYTTENNLIDFVGYCFQHLKLKYSTIKLYSRGARDSKIGKSGRKVAEF